MIFGEPSDFAIEVYHEPSGPQWHGFGRMAINIQGVRFGKIRENHCSLFAAVDRLRDVCPALESLWHTSFNGLPDTKIFSLIDGALYTSETHECELDYWPFDFLTNSGEQFDDAKTFIVCRPKGRVHVLYQFGDGTIGSASCTVDSFRRVAESLVIWFDEQVRTAGPPYFSVEPFLSK